MQGMVELGEEIFHMPVRLGMPQYKGSLEEVVRTPRFSTGIGLIMAGMEERKHHHNAHLQRGSAKQVLAKMKSWFERNF